MVVADGGGSRQVAGELLAISDDSVYTLRATTLFVSALATVQRATLGTYDPRSGDVARMAIGGTLLTVTHGVLLILTAPLWVIVGTASSAALSHAGK
jgi:hypothetical protein